MSVAALLQKRKEELAAKNLEEGKKFLQENASKTGVVVLTSGLQYKIEKVGTGATPKITDTVVCHYHGFNLKGEVFDSSVDRGTPATFKIQKLIKAYQEALPLMQVGSKWIIYSPSELAYKDEHKSKEIGANSTLIFEVELLEIVS